MFIVSLKYKVDLSEVDRHLEKHSAYLKLQFKRGFFVASGRKVPRTGGIILARAEDETELWQILEKDPFHENGIAEYEITEFTPTMTAEGYEILRD